MFDILKLEMDEKWNNGDVIFTSKRTKPREYFNPFYSQFSCLAPCVQVVQNWVASWNLSERQDERISFKLTMYNTSYSLPRRNALIKTRESPFFWHLVNNIIDSELDFCLLIMMGKKKCTGNQRNLHSKPSSVSSSENWES